MSELVRKSLETMRTETSRGQRESTADFCTLFDYRYLARGLVLYRSLRGMFPSARLRVFCMDDQTKRVLDELRLPGLTAIALRDLESRDRALQATKETRTQVEYCWTATPSVCLYALETEPGIEMITYLDADLMFFDDPAPIFDELRAGSVLLIPHRYSARWQRYRATSGTYNVQFMTFRRTPDGLRALNWWRNRCIEWCYTRYEDGKFGDQLYLEDWPERFRGVRVLEHVGGGVAPWNSEDVEFTSRGDKIFVNGEPLIFYHYHSLQVFRTGIAGRAIRHLLPSLRHAAAPTPVVWSTNYPATTREQNLVWKPYLRHLGEAIAEVRQVDSKYDCFQPLRRLAITTARKNVVHPLRRGASRIAKAAV